MKRCIVVADDDPGIVRLLTLRLGLARFNVATAADGEQALDLVREMQPMACILDVHMPRRGGLDVLETIKSDPALGRLPVMILSGEREAATVMQAMSCGANDYMVKPFDPDILLDRVSRMVKASTMDWTVTKQPEPVWEL